MIKKVSRTQVRQKKHRRMRNHIAGTAERPRLAVFRSNNICMRRSSMMQQAVLSFPLPPCRRM